jgi:hypothetical protein
MGQKKETFFMSYLNSITIVGFVGADPEQRPDGAGSVHTASGDADVAEELGRNVL